MLVSSVVGAVDLNSFVCLCVSLHHGLTCMSLEPLPQAVRLQAGHMLSRGFEQCLASSWVTSRARAYQLSSITVISFIAIIGVLDTAP